MKNMKIALAGATVLFAAVFCTPAQIPAPPAPQPPPPVVSAASTLASAGSSYGSPLALDRNRTLVVTKETAEPKSLSQTEEDLNVMARILEKAVNGEDRGKHAMGINIQSSLFGSDTPRNLYLEGYGVLFILNVPFPLSAPASNSDETEAKEETSSEWDEARQELYAGPSPGFAMSFSSFGLPNRFEPSQPYDRRKVEELKDSLVSALKNAVHIHRLQPKDQVTVVVIGGGNSGGSGGAKVVSRSLESGGRHSVDVFSRSSGQGPVSRMVLQATRDDIEAFQNGTLDLDQFRKRVSITLL